MTKDKDKEKMKMKSFISILFAMVLMAIPSLARAQVSNICTSSSPCYTTSNWGTGIGIYIAGASSSTNASLKIDNSSNAEPTVLEFGGGSSLPYLHLISTSGISKGLVIQATSGQGIDSVSNSGEGGFFESGTNNGVEGNSYTSGASGVYGSNFGSGYGVAGRSTGTGIGVYGDNTNSSGWSGYFNGRMYVSTGLLVAGNCVSGNCSSDERLKNNIQPLTGSLDKLMQLRPVTFEWTDAGKRTDRPAGAHVGLIAQQVETAIPSWVGTDADGHKTVNRDDLPIMMLDAIKTLKADNDALRTRVSFLEATRNKWSMSGFGLIAGLGVIAAVWSRKSRQAV